MEAKDNEQTLQLQVFFCALRISSLVNDLHGLTRRFNHHLFRSCVITVGKSGSGVDFKAAKAGLGKRCQRDGGRIAYRIPFII
jgi:hypothetical protein